MGKKQKRKTNNNKRSYDAKKPSSKNPNRSTTRRAKSKALPPVPDELFLDILLRLPVKSLFRFRSVCKRWSTIIDSPSFVDLHLSQSQTRPCEPQILVSFSLPDSKHYFYSSSLEGGQAVRLMWLPGNCRSPCYVSESLNGLVCFYHDSLVCVINPSTQKFRALPASNFKRFECEFYYFGFDPSKNEYKVLHIMCMRPLYCLSLFDMQCEVFTIKVGSEEPKEWSWRKIAHVPPYPYTFRGQGVCVNGAIHWICRKAPREVLVVFDVASEKFRSLPLPGGVSPEYNLRQIGGRLALLNDSDCDGSDIEIWVLEDCHNMWVQKTLVAPQKYEIHFTFSSYSNPEFSSEILNISKSQHISWDHRNKASRPIRPIRIDEVLNYGAGVVCSNVSITNYVDRLIRLY
ncbi:putative F-box protein At5g52610 [Cornus florida]|uniref:putative F-box protein At5g52610 n=1 Tax=Cornus florida TaxID=4283 RepID=UPI00289E6B6E|nr:putative F-box protein At5g52610 [Cornus florida]